MVDGAQIGQAIEAGVNLLVEIFVGNRLLAGLIVAAIALVFIVRRVRNRTSVLDPMRMFTAEQRRAGFARADSRCEFSGLLPFTRCRARASHGDHFYPWSKGGATSMENFVAACPTCNLRKSDSIPTMLTAWLIRARRRTYFPPGEPRLPGRRFGY